MFVVGVTRFELVASSVSAVATIRNKRFPTKRSGYPVADNCEHIGVHHYGLELVVVGADVGVGAVGHAESVRNSP